MKYGNNNKSQRLYEYMAKGGKLGSGYSKAGYSFMERGGKTKKKASDTSDVGDREKGEIYYDEQAGGFFEVKEGQQGTYAFKLTGQAGEAQKVVDYLQEKGGKDAVGLPAHRELEDKYPDLAMAEGAYQVYGAESNRSGKTTQTADSVRNSVLETVNNALSNDDALLMSAVINPYSGAADEAISGVKAYGFSRRGNVKGQERGVDFQPATVDKEGRMYQMGPTLLDEKTVVAEDPVLPGQTIETPEGEIIQVNPDRMQTPGFGEGKSNPGPDAPPRTRAEGAVPYQFNLGGYLKAQNGAKIMRSFRFPTS